MLKIKDFKFQINVSVEGYQSKTDALACLNQAGAKAIGRETMAFVEQDVTVTDFLALATKGYAFCNLFEYNPNKKYWFQDSKGKCFHTYPEHHRGKHKGAMKLCMKSDVYFKGAQTVFVDIDYTKYSNIKDYLNVLTYPPTCVYMSFSDNKIKNGEVSRRFRMVYVFDKVLDKSEFVYISHAINDSIVFDTSEPMDDDCGTRISQYMNGVYDNDEVYTNDCIYSVSDFPKDETGIDVVPASLTVEPSSSAQQEIRFNERMLSDMVRYSYNDFMHYYSVQYPYKYRIEKPDWIDNLYQLTDENYLQLWYYREKLVDGQHRRRKLFKNACLRRLMFPDMDPDTMLFNLYVDFVRFIENCPEDPITLETLVRKVKLAFEKTPEQLIAYCNQEINYWHEHRPQFIVHSGIKTSLGVINEIKQRIRYRMLDSVYDPCKSVKENIVQGIDVPQTSLYRYCKYRGIPTNPTKKMTEAQRREQAKKLRNEEIEQFKRLYQHSLSIRKNMEFMKQQGLVLSLGTINKWKDMYLSQTINEPIQDYQPIKLEMPSYDWSPFNSTESREYESERINDNEAYTIFSWEIPEINWSF